MSADKLFPDSVTGIGRIHHHFWGTYLADIVISYPTAAAAEAADSILLGWRSHPSAPTIRATRVDSDGLEAFLTEHSIRPEPCHRRECRGASHDPDSLAHSVDVGPEWSITVAWRDTLTLPLFPEQF